jgi:polyhydroxybutyrate depolymerase
MDRVDFGGVTGDGKVVSATLTVGGLERTFTLRLPAGRSERTPIVLVLHGSHSGASGRVMREWTTFDRQAEARGWAVAYPDGHGGSWADSRGVTPADEAGIDDVTFLRALIDMSAQQYGTLADAVVVAGVSNGACMAHRLATEAGDRVAVLAGVAAGLPVALADLQPAYAVSAMLIHGDADTVAPIGGGYSRHLGPGGELRGRVLSLAETAGYWRTVDRAAGRERTDTTEHSRRVVTDGGAGGTEVVAWTVFGGGHAWPGTATPPERGEPSTVEFDAAEEICRFAEPLLIPATARRL